MFPRTKRYIRSRWGSDKDFYRALKAMLGIVPDNVELYKVALIHKSASVMTDEGRIVNNERLEFLGDAILEGIVTDFLFIEYRDATEGEMTQMRSRLVSRISLDELATQIGLNDLVVSRYSGRAGNRHANGNALEAMIGAVYLDKGFDYANRFVIGMLHKYINFNELPNADTDYKSRLIEWCQKSKRSIRFATHYNSMSRSNHPQFTSTVIIDNIELGHGTGTSKKVAEQSASMLALRVLLNEENTDKFMNAIDNSAKR